MAQKHLYEQKSFAKTYLIPFLETHIPHFQFLNILEIGCAEAGLLDELDKKGVRTTGLELESQRVERALEHNKNLHIVIGDITDDKIVKTIDDRFDLIIMREVIEHVPDREKMINNIEKLLKDDGYIYITFPPKFSMFAGHQQNGRTLIRYIPYFHLSPEFIIRKLGKILNEYPHLINNIVINYRIGLTIGRFEKLFRQFQMIRQDLFFIRPIYKLRFNLNPIKMINIPFLREFITTGCECILQKQKGTR